MVSSPAADAATTSAHIDGPDCDACPTFEDWVEAHCYGCGQPFDAATVELLHRAFHSESLVEQNDAIDELAARPSEHKDCLR